MKENILDDFYFDKKGIKNNNDIKARLKIGNMQNHYEHINGTVIVKMSEPVKVSVRLENGQIKIKRLFPTIGNSAQILASAILLAICLVLPVPFPFQWVVAVLGGQIFSYIWHAPKIKKLEERVEGLLQ